MRLKRQEMSSALSALYRAETVGQSLVWGQFSDYPVYRRVTNDAVTCVDSLPSYYIGLCPAVPNR